MSEFNFRVNDVLNSKRYVIDNGDYVILTYDEIGRLIDIITSFSSECMLSVKTKIRIEQLNDEWEKSLRNGMSIKALEDKLSKGSKQEGYIENIIAILKNERTR